MPTTTSTPRLLAVLATLTLVAGPAGCRLPDGTDPADAARDAARATARAAARTVPAAGETTSVPGDADDPAIWVHPTDPARSLVIGTDKDHGLVTWSLDGRVVQEIPSGEPNNVDVRYGFSLGGATVDIVATGNRETSTIDVYRVDPVARRLGLVSGDGIVPRDLDEIYGFCMYRSLVQDRYYAFVNDKDGDVEQWELFDDDGAIHGRLVRAFDVGTRTEGCVADTQTGMFFISAERQSIWRYGAEPGDADARILVDGAATDGPGDHLVPEVEGLAIYYGPGGAGYLIASSQGSDDFVVYDRRPPHRYIGRFHVVADGGSDAVTHTDGIAVTNVALGRAFAHGLLVVQDAHDEDPYNNFKLVAWQDVARGLDPPLMVDTWSYDPRNPTQVRLPSATTSGRATSASPAASASAAARARSAASSSGPKSASSMLKAARSGYHSGMSRRP